MSHTPPADNGPADARGAAAAALLGPLSFFIEPDDGDADSLEDEESWAPLAARPEWAGFEPGPLDAPQGRVPVAAVEYTPRQREALAYFRAVVAAGEVSARALALTEEARAAGLPARGRASGRNKRKRVRAAAGAGDPRELGQLHGVGVALALPGRRAGLRGRALAGGRGALAGRPGRREPQKLPAVEPPAAPGFRARACARRRGAPRLSALARASQLLYHRQKAAVCGMLASTRLHPARRTR